MTILDDIIAYKKDEVALAKSNTPLSALSELAQETTSPRGFENALRKNSETQPALIAEIKKASPSKGLIRDSFVPADHARAYENAGATCLSVLTDRPSFQGSPDHLVAARAATHLPIIRKDFMIDPYQVYEARAWGADCILLILACLSDGLAGELQACAGENGLDVLVETHNEDEMGRAGKLGASLIGVNNRNLNTFETSLSVTARLAQCAPAAALLVSESGISTNQDIQRLSADGARAYLVGETLMRQPDLETATRNLLSPVQVA